MFLNCNHGTTRVLLSVHTANCTRSRAKALLLVSRSHRETKRAVVLSGPVKLRALSVRGGLSPAVCYFFPLLRGGGVSWKTFESGALNIINFGSHRAFHSGHLYSDTCPTLSTFQKHGTEGAFKRL